MKLMIASDLHGSAYCVKKLMDAYAAEKPEKLLLLGDLLYHGPRNALPRDYDCMAVAGCSMPSGRTSSPSGATVTARWIRWCWSSPCWATTRCWSGRG